MTMVCGSLVVFVPCVKTQSFRNDRAHIVNLDAPRLARLGRVPISQPGGPALCTLGLLAADFTRRRASSGRRSDRNASVGRWRGEGTGGVGRCWRNEAGGRPSAADWTRPAGSELIQHGLLAEGGPQPNTKRAAATAPASVLVQILVQIRAVSILAVQIRSVSILAGPGRSRQRRRPTSAGPAHGKTRIRECQGALVGPARDGRAESVEGGGVVRVRYQAPVPCRLTVLRSTLSLAPHPSPLPSPIITTTPPLHDLHRSRPAAQTRREVIKKRRISPSLLPPSHPPPTFHTPPLPRGEESGIGACGERR
jgi:hypothetical protein